MISALLNDYKLIIENRIDELYPETSAENLSVIKAMRYSLLLGGKRIRPILLIEFCKLCGGKLEDALDFAVALEFIHTYSLIHDDLPCMDNDDMRRGKPSCHIAFGEDMALLAGDALLNEAFCVASNANVSCEKAVKAIGVLAYNAGINGMLSGQVLDLSFVKNPPLEKELREMYLKKTGALLVSAAKIGCILAGADENDIKNATIYAEKLGLAFQVIDDILDYIGDEEVLGKPIGSDDKNGKTTYVTLFGLEKAKKIAEDLSNEALQILKEFKGDTTNLELLTNFLLNRNY